MDERALFVYTMVRMRDHVSEDVNHVSGQIRSQYARVETITIVPIDSIRVFATITYRSTEPVAIKPPKV